MGRNIFRDAGFKNVDFSVFKNFTFKERFGAQFRVEFFNVLNHPIIANPFGSVNGYAGGSDPSSPGTFGCGCTTPDIRGRQSDRRFGRCPHDTTRVEAQLLTSIRLVRGQNVPSHRPPSRKQLKFFVRD